MKNSLLIGMLFFLLWGCEKDTADKVIVDGTWVETTQKMDTLLFLDNNQKFTLNRGTEIRGGQLLPKYLSGPYSYTLQEDSIALVWQASSCLCKVNYYFKIDTNKDQIQIGNFFIDSLSNNVVLTFNRIR